VPALSHAAADDKWEGETGFVHEVVSRHLRQEMLAGPIDAYACGPTPMIDAVLPILQVNAWSPTTSISISLRRRCDDGVE